MPEERMHTELNSKEDFAEAINKDQGKFIFILAYEGEPPAGADDRARQFSDKVVPYKFDVSKAPKAKEAHGITQTPCALIFKNGQLVKKVDGMAPEGMKERPMEGQGVAGSKVIPTNFCFDDTFKGNACAVNFVGSKPVMDISQPRLNNGMEWDGQYTETANQTMSTEERRSTLLIEWARAGFINPSTSRLRTR
ncbi:hypothetical protein LTR36_009413 [Oleoguttula mirabilis]|uniref:Thioredoxin domain-containing protein n=1 Tax=Oleoguttula mirabilis TaxID=1507867 RepID=A0AAV9JSP0_9PEZI|nr:hypothetical protein LTR36_009413 [Oleoguttula mirabilis]